MQNSYIFKIIFSQTILNNKCLFITFVANRSLIGLKGFECTDILEGVFDVIDSDS
jgi:hypothetical protein